jgi:hypothetical protein
MTNANLAGNFADPPVVSSILPRPSTIRRIEKLRALVTALAARDMGYVSVAALLECSPTSSRQYLAQLADAGVVSYRPGRRPGSTGGGSYRLNADPRAARVFLSTLTAADVPATKLRRTIRPRYAGIPGGRYVHVMDGDSLPRSTDEGRARRDPLVAALFGEAAS